MSQVGKREIDGKQHLVAVNPATLEEIGTVLLMGPDEIKAQVDRADAAFPAWKALSLRERIRHLLMARDYMVDHVDEVAETISSEMGKPRVEALTADILTIADLITHYSKRAPKVLEDQKIPMHLFKMVRRSYIRYEPLGVVSVIAPWNFPFAIPMSGIVFALLTGNTVVFKPASDAVFIGKRIEEILNGGGRLPKGVFNLVTASGSSMGNLLYEPPVKKVVFTGSTETGKWIMQEAGKHLIPTVLELGGKDPMVVLEDADVEKTARAATWGAFTNAGQVCASVERCYVHEAIHDEFLEQVRQNVEALRVGQDTDHQVEMGPVVNEEQLRIAEEHIRDAVEKGATVVTGGKRMEGRKGYFFEPTVLKDVNHDMACIREETFGPTLPVMRFRDEAEAIQLANDSQYGLTASVWSRDRGRAERVARHVESGTVAVNDHATSYGIVETPWQGMKDSGVGRSHSDEGLKEFVFPKHITIDRTPLSAQPWWYPYSPEKYEAFKAGIRGLFGSGSKLGALARFRKIIKS